MVSVKGHPKFGDYFFAKLDARRDQSAPHARNRAQWDLAPPSARVHASQGGVLDIRRGCVPAEQRSQHVSSPGLEFVAKAACRRGEVHEIGSGDFVGMNCPLRSTWHAARAWPWRT